MPGKETRQLNVRLPQESWPFLEAEAFLEGVTVPSLVKHTIITSLHERAQTYRQGIGSNTIEPTNAITDFLQKYDAAFAVEDSKQPEK